MEISHIPVDDNLTTQRLYWYRKQRLNHPLPPNNFTVTSQLEGYNHRPDISGAVYYNMQEYRDQNCPPTSVEYEKNRLSSCRYDKADNYSNTSTSPREEENHETKSSQAKKDLANLPPLDISEVIDTLTTLSSEGKLGRSSNSPKESDEENSKTKGIEFICK